MAQCHMSGSLATAVNQASSSRCSWPWGGHVHGGLPSPCGPSMSRSSFVTARHGLRLLPVNFDTEAVLSRRASPLRRGKPSFTIFTSSSPTQGAFAQGSAGLGPLKLATPLQLLQGVMTQQVATATYTLAFAATSDFTAFTSDFSCSGRCLEGRAKSLRMFSCTQTVFPYRQLLACSSSRRWVLRSFLVSFLAFQRASSTRVVR